MVPPKKKSIWFVVSSNCELIFCLQDCHSSIVKLNVKARQDIPEFLTANLLLIHSIVLDVDWSWKFLENYQLQSWWAGFNFEFLLNSHWDCWSVTQWISSLRCRLLKRIFKSNRNLSTQCRSPYMAFKHCVSFATDLAANFGFYWPRIIIIQSCKRLIPAVRLESEQTRFSRTGRWFTSAALDRIQFWTCSFVPMLYFHSGTNEWWSTWKDWAKWHVLFLGQ